MDSKTLATLAFLDAFGAEQSLLTYFADLSGPALRYFFIFSDFWCPSRVQVQDRDKTILAHFQRLTKAFWFRNRSFLLASKKKYPQRLCRSISLDHSGLDAGCECKIQNKVYYISVIISAKNVTLQSRLRRPKAAAATYGVVLEFWHWCRLILINTL